MKTKYKKEELELIVKSSYNWSEVCRKLNLSTRGGSQSHIKKVSMFFNIDNTHFTGSKPFNSKPKGLKYPIDDYLSGKRGIASSGLRKRLINEGYKKDECELCGLSTWCSEKIPLELDHINSNHLDNSLKNLQILCPNCHSLKTKKDRENNRKEKAKKKTTKELTELRKSYLISSRKTIRPALEILLDDVSHLGYCGTGRKYGVSDNAIRKWIKSKF